MKKRIEYIDALRGFTMILVVAVHVYSLCFMHGDVKEYDLSFNNFFGLFRMPLFFFISGFVFYKSDRVWNFTNLRKFLTSKVRVQIFSTLVFFLLFCFLFQKDIKHSLFDSQKAGYWFTYILFIYFTIYIVIDKIISWISKRNAFSSYTIFTTIIVGILLFYFINNGALLNILSPKTTSLLSLSKWQYFIFFSFGSFIHKYYTYFLKWQEYRSLKDAIIFIFICAAIFIFYQNNNHIIISNTFIKLCTALFGIVIVMFIFRDNESHLSNSTRIGRLLQSIGKRTLDIYFLHYFFLPYNLSAVGQWFSTNQNPLLEFILSIVLAIFVIICCLTTSRIIRISTSLTYLLLGGKKQ